MSDDQKNVDKDAEAINRDLLLNHEYDGILEYDNPMPKWWKWIFWLSFYFSIVYFAHYHLTGNGDSVQETYELAMAEAREAEAAQALGGEVSEQALAKLLRNESMMTDAKKLFVLRCAQCHGNNAEGKIGPNLTDDRWLHGDASLMSIFQIISDGVQTKGMPPWKRQLREIERAKLAAYVGSVRDTNVPGKAPEGKQLETPPLPAVEASVSAEHDKNGETNAQAPTE